MFVYLLYIYLYFNKELDAMIGKTSVFPEYLLNTDDDGKFKEDIVEDAGLHIILDLTSPSTSTASTPIHNMKRKHNYAAQLKELTALKQKHHEEQLDLKRRKLEAYERRTEKIAEKADCLIN